MPVRYLRARPNKPRQEHNPPSNHERHEAPKPAPQPIPKGKSGL